MRYGGRGSSSGSVLAECAVVLPALLLLIVGVMETGQTLTQMFWFGQTTYQVAYLAAETEPSGRVARSWSLFRDLERLHRDGLSRTVGTERASDRDGSVVTGTGAGKDFVTASFAARTRPLTAGMFTGRRFDVAFIAPELVSGSLRDLAHDFRGSGPSGREGDVAWTCCGERLGAASSGPGTCGTGGSTSSRYACSGNGNVGKPGYFR